MKPVSRYIGAGAAALLLTISPLTAQTVEIKTATGPVELPAAPSPIAVYDVAAIDTLQALGVLADGTPANVFVDYLQDNPDAAPVGTLFEPDLEAVAVLEPELIILGGRSVQQAESLSRLGTTIDMTIPAEDLAGAALDRLAAYGTLFDREAKAAELADAFEARLQETRDAVAGKGNALVILTNGPKMSAYGKGSRFGWVHDVLGFPEAAEDLEVATHGNAVSFEFIAETDPDWLVVIDRGAAIGAEGASAHETLSNPLVENTRAWQSGQVIYLDPAPIYVAGGGYTSLMRSMDQVLSALAD